MGLLSKLGSIAGTAIGGPIGGMIGGALGSAAGGVLGGGAAKKQTKNALNDLNAAQAQGMAALGGARDAAVAPYQPFIQGGTTAYQNALAMTQPGYQFNTNDPLYQFEVSEGQRMADRSAASKGSLYSGGTLRALTRLGQGLAGNAYQQQFNNSNQLAQFGLQAAQGNAAAQSSYGANTANLLSNLAQARVPVYGARGDAIAGQYGSLFGALDSIGGGLGGLGGLSGAGGGSTLADAWGFKPTPSGNVDFVNTPSGLSAAFGF